MKEPNHRQRIAPQPGQVKRAASLLSKVPPLSYDWASDEGHAFLRYACDLVEEGVPVAWLAMHLSLDSARLYAALTRFEKGQTA